MRLLRILLAMHFSRKYFAFTVVMLFATWQASATHYRAGEILYRLIGNFKYEATVVTYTKTSSAAADRDYLEYFFWGDGTQDTLYRVNGPDADGNGIPDGEPLPNDIKKNIYKGTHTYPGVPPSRFYVIKMFDPNRIDGINNIDGGNSVNIPFYVEDTIRFPTTLENIGFNSSPILLNPPIDYASVNDTFVHNPNAYDPDGDSLDFTLIVPLQNEGVVVPNYLYLNQYIPGPNNTVTIDRHTGELVWAVPPAVGIYNIAIFVREYRRGILMGTLIRDMQIIVLSNPNDPPQLTALNDTCVWAGERLSQSIVGTDRNPTQTVIITADGGTFQVVNPSTFNATSGNPATGFYNWQTVCEHIRSQPYVVVFKASDNYSIGGNAAPLVDMETWSISVLAPPPTGLTANATPNTVTLNWDNPYACATIPTFRGFSVWRKKGCDLFVPDRCETGLDGRGYSKLTSANIFTYTFTDNSVVVGEEYTYRILAHFSQLSPNGLFEYDITVSVPSNGVCTYLPISIPVITNVSVEATDVALGKVFVRWTKPLAGGNNLDTIQFPPPYRFDVYRGGGFNLNAPVLTRSFTSPSYSAITDTSFTDTLLNTVADAWSYRIEFYSQNDTVGVTPVASSVFLTVQPSDQSLKLSWQESVPWSNDSFVVFKRNNATSVYDSLTTVYTRSYIDTGLINDSTYCYYIKAYGSYGLAFIQRPLINLSQQACGVPVDTLPPCPPVLEVTNDCEQYLNEPWITNEYYNYLRWSALVDPCSEDINHYLIYFGADSASMVLLDSTITATDTVFTHTLTTSLAGCYAIKAVDRVGNVSRYSNVFCIDNCPLYQLPNTFTPNGDGANDVFHPFLPYRFVPKIEMKIFNRWGDKVFETEDPYIGWDGTDQKTGKPLSDGVYLYAGFYYEERLGGWVKKPLSGEKKGGGFIHLIRGK